MASISIRNLVDAVLRVQQMRFLRTDRRAAFTSRAFMAWAHKRRVRHLLDDAGSPTQNAYIDSFNGKFRDECLNEQWFVTLVQSRQEIARWRCDYNEARLEGVGHNDRP